LHIEIVIKSFFSHVIAKIWVHLVNIGEISYLAPFLRRLVCAESA
jgi:hypothetical protein